MDKDKIIAWLTAIGILSTIFLNYGSNYYNSLKEQELIFYIARTSESTPASTLLLMNNTFPIISQNANNYYLSLYEGNSKALERRANETAINFNRYQRYENKFTIWSLIFAWISLLGYFYLLKNWEYLQNKRM